MNVAIKWGIIYGIAGVVLITISNAGGLATSTWGGITIGLLSLAVAIFAVRSSLLEARRTLHSNTLTFGQGFQYGIVTMLLGAIVTQAYNALYITVIDPGFLKRQKKEMAGMYERMGLPEEASFNALERLPDTVGEAILNPMVLGFTLGFAVLVALIAAAVLKKSKDDNQPTSDVV